MISYKILSENEVAPVPRWIPGAEPMAVFPGVAECGNGELVMTVVSGSSFESADQRVVVLRSQDYGRSWQEQGPLYDYDGFWKGSIFSDCCKPTALGGGRMIAAGYGFERDEPALELSGYAAKYGHFPRCRNAVWHSEDGGRSWSTPQWIDHPYAGIEWSGPALAANNGRLLCFGPPFTLSGMDQSGLCFASDDGGVSWYELSTFLPAGTVAPWESRAMRLASGRLAVIFWAFDFAGERHLNNHLVYSDDNGATWSEPVDTGLRGQASNLIEFDGAFGILQARREGEAPGIYLSSAVFEGAKLHVGESVQLWDGSGKANCAGHIEQQFRNLKFGQPALQLLGNGEHLLSFWYCDGDRYRIKCVNLQFELGDMRPV